MKYKSGDKVLVRSDLEIGKKYGSNTFESSMSNLAKKTVTISYAYERNESYNIEEDNNQFYWTDEMFEQIFRVGDKVKVKEDLEDDGYYGVDRIKFAIGMTECRDKIVTIKSKLLSYRNTYYIEEESLNYLWSGAMFEPIEENRKEPKKEVKEKIKDNNKSGAKGMDLLQKYLEDIENQIDGHIIKTVGEKFKDLSEIIEKSRKLKIEIGDKETEITGLKHENLDNLIKMSALRLPVLLVGMAGTGKTHAAEQVSDALKVSFYSMSVGAQTSKSDIMGYMNANGEYVKTHFRQAYEKGGVFLMDELDAGNANVLIQVNSALSNGVCAFPDKMVKAHKNFIFIATANTYGNGANRQYVGRNQLDAATLDRFTILNWDIDKKLELSFSFDNKKWYKSVVTARKYILDHNIRALVTPRATQKGAKLLAAGFDIKDVINNVLLTSVPEDKQPVVRKVAMDTYKEV